MKILLVDDELEFVSTLAERLEFRGFKVDWATRPEQALDLASASFYDLAILDVKMPRVNGIALKKLLQEKCPKMKFIFLTGHGSEESFIAGASEAGTDFYLLKPVQIEKLVAKIKSCCTNEKEGADE